MRRLFLFLLFLCALLAGSVSLLFCKQPATSETAETTLEAPPQEIPSLPEITPSSLDFVSNGNGTCTVIGIGSFDGGNLVIPSFSPSGDRVCAIAPRAFYGSSEILAVHIPATVLYLGDLALADCPHLSLVSVSADNPSYRSLDGVLYSKDLSTLILYPPSLGGRVVHIGRETRHISEMAFYQCLYPVSLVYDGSPADWEEISIASKNYALSALPKQFLGD